MSLDTLTFHNLSDPAVRSSRHAVWPNVQTCKNFIFNFLQSFHRKLGGNSAASEVKDTPKISFSGAGLFSCLTFQHRSEGPDSKVNGGRIPFCCPGFKVSVRRIVLSALLTCRAALHGFPAHMLRLAHLRHVKAARLCCLLHFMDLRLSLFC